jgi:hypothetical protein
MTMIFEVRVEGELAEPTLHSLGCAHCLARAQTSMRVEATATDLHRLLETCSENGLTIESVVRIDPPRLPVPQHLATLVVSTTRARAPGEPHQLDD